MASFVSYAINHALAYFTIWMQCTNDCRDARFLSASQMTRGILLVHDEFIIPQSSRVLPPGCFKINTTGERGHSLGCVCLARLHRTHLERKVDLVQKL